MAYIILFVNFLAYIVLLCWHFYRNRWNLTAKSVLILAWAGIAFMGWLTFISGIYQSTFGFRDPEKLSAVPFVLCFIMFLLLLKPLDFHFDTQILGQFRNKRIERKIFILAIILITILLFQFVITIQTYSFDVFSNYGEMYDDRASGEDVIIGSSLTFFIYSKFVALGRVLTPIVFSLLFLSIAGDSRKRKIKVILLLVLVVEASLTKLLSANRGGVFFTLMTLTFFLATFYHNLSTGVRRGLWVLFGSCFLILSISMAFLSESRFGDDKESSAQTQRYFGEPFPNLGYNIWDKEIRHPYGTRFFPTLSETFGFSKKREFIGRNSMHWYWERFVGIPMLNFKTIFGDLYVEFGLLGSFLFIILFCRFFTYLIRRNKAVVFQITLLSIWYDIVVFGMFNNILLETKIVDILYTLIALFLMEYYVFSKSGRLSNLCWNWK